MPQDCPKDLPSVRWQAERAGSHACYFFICPWLAWDREADYFLRYSKTYGLVAHSASERMSTDTLKSPLESCSRVAERMRLYRKRRRQGLRPVRILLRVTEIDEFIRLGLLEEEQRESPEALQAVVANLLHQIMEEIRDAYPLLVTVPRPIP
jgi:hypothetical protein